MQHSNLDFNVDDILVNGSIVEPMMSPRLQKQQERRKTEFNEYNFEQYKEPEELQIIKKEE